MATFLTTFGPEPEGSHDASADGEFSPLGRGSQGVSYYILTRTPHARRRGQAQKTMHGPEPTATSVEALFCFYRKVTQFEVFYPCGTESIFAGTFAHRVAHQTVSDWW